MSPSLTAEHLLNLMAGWESRRGPRYLALADAIQETVHREELEDGTRLPPERALAALAQLGRGTVVAAYAELSERGVVERRQGSGTRLTTGVAPSGSRPLRAALFGRAVQDDDFTQGAFGEAVCALDNSLLTLSFFRAYTPELVGWFDDFGHSGYIDALSGIGRIGLGLNQFSVSLPGGSPNLLEPLTGTELEAALDTGNTRRCPGGNERPVTDIDPADDSVPFTDGGALTDGAPGDCDPSHVQPGP